MFELDAGCFREFSENIKKVFARFRGVQGYMSLQVVMLFCCYEGFQTVPRGFKEFHGFRRFGDVFRGIEMFQGVLGGFRWL